MQIKTLSLENEVGEYHSSSRKESVSKWYLNPAARSVFLCKHQGLALTEESGFADLLRAKNTGPSPLVRTIILPFGVLQIIPLPAFIPRNLLRAYGHMVFLTSFRQMHPYTQ